MGITNEEKIEIKQFEDLDIHDLQILLIGERRDNARLKKEITELTEQRAKSMMGLDRAEVYQCFLSDRIKVYVTFSAFEDVSVPSPLEVEDWRPVKTCTEDSIRAVCMLSGMRSMKQAQVFFNEKGGEKP